MEIYSHYCVVKLAFQVQVFSGRTSVKSPKFSGPTISPFFKRKVHFAGSFPTLTGTSSAQEHVECCSVPASGHPSFSAPLSFCFPLSALFFSSSWPSFTAWPFHCFLPLAWSSSLSLCSPPLPFLHLPCSLRKFSLAFHLKIFSSSSRLHPNCREEAQ